jgi:hypothetical protein
MAKATKPKSEVQESEIKKSDEKDIKLVCGIEILSESIEEAGFEPNLVSFADDIGVIQKRIIQNLYDNPIVICDVSGKNPNVMFELGIRLAFDKPTIIIKDDKTSYSFDTSPIEHIEYPRDLRFNRMVDFKEQLVSKVTKTYEKSISDLTYSTFLKHFGEFKIAKINKKEVSGQEYVLEEIRSLRMLMLENNRRPMESNRRVFISGDRTNNGKMYVCLKNATIVEVNTLARELSLIDQIVKATITKINPAHFHILLTPVESCDLAALKVEIKKVVGDKHKVYFKP